MISNQPLCVLLLPKNNGCQAIVLVCGLGAVFYVFMVLVTGLYKEKRHESVR